MKCGRKPPIYSVDTQRFSNALKTWWYKLQPDERGEGGQHRPTVPLPPTSWSLLARSGRNGLFLVILSLFWWRHSLDKVSDEAVRLASRQEWEHLVGDVNWTLNAIEKSGSETPTGSMTPSTSRQRGGHADATSERGKSPSTSPDTPRQTRDSSSKRRGSANEANIERKRRKKC